MRTTPNAPNTRRNRRGTIQQSGITPKRFAVAAVAALFVTLILLSFAPEAEAGTFQARECDVPATGQAYGAPDLVPEDFGYYTRGAYCGSGESYGGLSIGGNTNIPRGHYSAWNFYAANGTRFLSGHADIKAYTGIAGHVGRLSTGDGAQLLSHPWSGSTANNDWQRIDWTAPTANTRQLVLWEICEQTTDYCPGNDTFGLNYVFGRQFVFTLIDETAPTGIGLSGGLVGPGWKSGVQSATLSGSDVGSGTWLFDLYVNGQHLSRQQNGCGQLGNGDVQSFAPCPGSDGKTFSPNVGAGPFVQGANNLQGCVFDFANNNPNGTCTSTQSVMVDSVAPDQVTGLGIAGGEGWKSTSDFDLTWGVPGGESTSDSSSRSRIVGARYRVQGPGGYDQTRFEAFDPGEQPDRINDVAVGSTPGAYTAKVHLVDAAGNESVANDATANLRFDPTVPPASAAEFDGWIRRNDFEHTAEWSEVPAGTLGPSGLEGYAVRVTQDPDSDPCVTPGDPNPTCVGDEVNNDGASDTQMAVSDRAEGDWYIHVLPVSGAGVKAPIEHTEMPVDKTDPQTTLSGTSDDWSNENVTVSATASDALSSMAPDPAFSVDPQPRTCIQLDIENADCEPDADVTRVISSEGEHTLRYFARDLAGNENNGLVDAGGRVNNPPAAAAVRIDKTAPMLAFASHREANDPAAVMVDVSDSLSGVTGGTIELRRQGGKQSWLALETSLDEATLVGRVPDDMDPGMYEFRASALDRAGNAGTTTRRGDGSVMVEELPLKEGVRLTAGIQGAGTTSKPPKGKCKDKGKCKPGKGSNADAARIRYGEAARLSGALRSLGDNPLRGRELEVTERMADGSEPATRSRSVTTDGDGSYAIDLAAGPSRTVTVSYAGDQRYRATDADPVEMRVSGAVLAFRSPRKVPETKAIPFRGRVGANGVNLGGQGKRVELQYEKSRRNWRTIDSAQTNAGGRFKIRYALRADYIRPTAVRFRLLVPPERAWPYDGSVKSRARRTVILP